MAKQPKSKAKPVFMDIWQKNRALRLCVSFYAKYRSGLSEGEMTKAKALVKKLGLEEQVSG